MIDTEAAAAAAAIVAATNIDRTGIHNKHAEVRQQQQPQQRQFVAIKPTHR